MKQNDGQPKKILHTTTRIVLGGGVEKNIYYTIAHLASEYQFHLSCGPDYQPDIFASIAPLKIIICPHLVNRFHLIKDLRALWFYYRLIRRERYDIVHTHETKASFITKLAAWLAGCPYIIYGLHGVTFNDPMPLWKRQFYILLEKLTIRCADLVVAVGQETLQAYHQKNIGRGIAFEIVRSGIDVPAFLQQALLTPDERVQFRQSMGIGANDVVLINVGRFSVSKAQRFAIVAFAALRQQHPSLKFLLLGDGPLLDTCRHLAESLQVPADSIYFLGYQPDVARYLSISDIFIFTSLREGLPRVMVEAALLKLPCVCFEVEGAREIIVQGQSGFIVPQPDLPQLMEKTEALITNPSLSASFGECSFAHVTPIWKVETMIDRLREIYGRSPQH